MEFVDGKIVIHEEDLRTQKTEGMEAGSMQWKGEEMTKETKEGK